MSAAIKSGPALRAALTEVRRALKAAEAKIGPLPASTFGSERSAYWERRREVMRQLAADLSADLGARIADDWRGARVRLAGVTATSTAGLAGALRNWCAGAARKLDDAEARP